MGNFEIRNDGHVWNSLDDKTFLEKLGGYRKDRRTGVEGLTLAGLMMFGTGQAIREIFDNVFMFTVFTRLAVANDKTAVRQSAMVLFHFFLGNEMHRRMIVRKIVGHSLNFVFDTGFICAVRFRSATAKTEFLPLFTRWLEKARNR